MEDGAGTVHIKNASKSSGKHLTPTRPKTDMHNARKYTKNFDNISLGSHGFSPMGRDSYDRVEYKDVFGGPPRCIFSRNGAEEEPSIPRRSYDEVFKAFEKELNLTRGSKNLPVFEFSGCQNSSVPVFDLPVFGGSELPVFELPSSREDLGSRGTTSKSSSAEFYDDVFGGGGRLSTSVREESTTKRVFSRPSVSRSKSSSSQLSSEDPSPHHHALPSMAGDHPLSASASKLRPCTFSSKPDRSFVKRPSGTRQAGYQSQCSDNVSVLSSGCSSPSQILTDTASVPSYRVNKPRKLSKMMEGVNTDDVFGGFPQHRHLTHKKACQKAEESISDFKIGLEVGNLDRTDIFEKCPICINTSRKSSTKYVYEVGDHVNASTPSDQTDMADASLVLEFAKETSFSIDTMHLMSQNLLGSSPSELIAGPQKVKSWRDWIPELKNSPFNLKYCSSASSLSSSNVSLITDTAAWAQEEPEEVTLEALERNSLDDGESSDVIGSYVIEIVPDRRKNLVVHDKNYNHPGDSSVLDASDMAIKEAIAWAKEKYQLGNCKERKEDTSTFVEGPTEKDMQEKVCDGNTKGVRQCGNDVSINVEGRMQQACDGSTYQRNLVMFENCEEGLISQSEHSLESKDQLSVRKEEIDQHPQETELCLLPGQCATTDAKERPIKEVSNGVIVDYNEHTMNQDGVDPFFGTKELQNAYAMGITSDILSGGEANQMDFSRLLEELACDELEKRDFHAHSSVLQTSQYKRNCTVAPCSDTQTAILKEITQRRTQLDQ